MDAAELKKMTVAELREEARKLGDAKGVASMKKDDLVRLLSGEAGEGASGSGAHKSALRDMPALKQRIRELKKERATAGERAAKSKVQEFNAELRRYRRRLRKAARRRRRATRQAS